MPENSEFAIDRDGGTATSWRILEAVSYLDQCRASGRGLAVLTGESGAEVRLVLKRFLAGSGDGQRVARVLAPTDSRHAFLEALLAQLGFERFESTADDLQRLLNVVLRQGASQKSTTVILVEDAHQFGPRVLELIRDLIRGSRDLSPPPCFILTGKPALHRVLDSKGMASVAGLARQRFDLSARPAPTADPTGVAAPGDGQDSSPCLVLSLDSVELARFPLGGDRLLIGRGPHCDMPIVSRFVSRQHALLLRNPEGDWIVDLKSTNGTSVNSQLIGQRRLAHGDVISIGNHRLRYQNSAARGDGPEPQARADQLSETMVMRSLQAVVTPSPAPAGADPASTTAA